MVEENGINPDIEEISDKNEYINGWRAFAMLGQFLEDDSWHPQQLEDLRCYAQIRVDLEQFIFYVVAPVKAPDDIRSAVAEYITRANYGLRIGNFEMDFDDGEIRYKSSIDFEDSTLDTALIKNIIYPAVHTMDYYLPGLLNVMFGNHSPEQAIVDIEG
jgi:hypothetical protein